MYKRTERKKTRRGTERLDLGEAADKRLEDGVARAVLVRNADGNGELVNVAQSLKHGVVLAPPLPRIRVVSHVTRYKYHQSGRGLRTILEL